MRSSLIVSAGVMFFAGLSIAHAQTTFGGIDASANGAYGSDLQPPPHPDALPQPPVEWEQKNGVWRAHHSREKMVETENSKPAEMKKVEFGADVTQPTGVFKGSLLDSDLAMAKPTKTEEKKSADKDKKKEPKPEPSASVSAAISRKSETNDVDKTAAPALNVGLSLASSPPPVAAPAASPRQ